MAGLVALAVLAALLAAGPDRPLAKHIPNTIAGPFTIIPERVGSCPPNLRPARKYYQYEYSAIRDRKVTHVWYYSGNLTTFITADNNITLFFTADSWKARGGWAPNAFTLEVAKPCTFAQTHFRKYWRIAVNILFKDPNRTCPFPPTFVSVSNISTDVDIQVPPAFYYGRYRVTAWGVNSVTKELLGCERGYCSVVPKTRRPRCHEDGDNITCD